MRELCIREEAALRDNVRAVLASICPPAVVRAAYEGKGDLSAVGFGEAAIAVNNAATVVDPAARLFPGHSSDPH